MIANLIQFNSIVGNHITLIYSLYYNFDESKMKSPSNLNYDEKIVRKLFAE